MDFPALAAQRYSLRKYSDRPVEDEKLQLILQAAQSAPTAHNLQPQRIFVLRSAQALEKADACMDSHFHPPVILAVTYDAQCAWTREGDGKNHGEIDAARGAIGQLGGRIERIDDYAVPCTDIRHRVVVIRKVRPTPAQFPRAFAKIKKSPLK